MVKSKTIKTNKYSTGKPNTNTDLLNADIIGKFKSIAAKMQTKANR